VPISIAAPQGPVITIAGNKEVRIVIDEIEE
jgi:hypothetical protein